MEEEEVEIEVEVEAEVEGALQSITGPKVRLRPAPKWGAVGPDDHAGFASWTARSFAVSPSCGSQLRKGFSVFRRR